METYRVVSITDRKGNPRIEGRYPLRVGRMCKKPTPRNGDAMMIEWLAQPDGTPYVGMIVTSMVIGFKTEDRGKYIEVTTKNSIYTFERVREKQKLLSISARSTRTKKKSGERSRSL